MQNQPSEFIPWFIQKKIPSVNERKSKMRESMNQTCMGIKFIQLKFLWWGNNKFDDVWSVAGALPSTMCPKQDGNCIIDKNWGAWITTWDCVLSFNSRLFVHSHSLLNQWYFMGGIEWRLCWKESPWLPRLVHILLRWGFAFCHECRQGNLSKNMCSFSKNKDTIVAYLRSNNVPVHNLSMNLKLGAACICCVRLEIWHTTTTRWSYSLFPTMT